MTDEWTGWNPRLWARCARHGRYDAQDGACPDCVRQAECEDDGRPDERREYEHEISVAGRENGVAGQVRRMAPVGEPPGGSDSPLSTPPSPRERGGSDSARCVKPGASNRRREDDERPADGQEHDEGGEA